MASPSKRLSRSKWAGRLLVGAIVALALLSGRIGSAGGASSAPTGSASGTSSVPPASTTAKHDVTLPNGLMTHYVQQSAAQTKAYWTPARMAAAKPIGILTRSGTPLSGATSSAASGTPQKANGWAPAGLSAGPAVVNPPQASPSGAASAQTQCQFCFIPFTRYYYFARYRTYPVSTVGKLFFTNDGGNYVCSASVIFTDTLDTAGHCVANTDGTHMWDSSALFCPSYNAGVNGQVGCWAANFFVAWSQWITDGSFEWDFGGINTSNCGTVHCTDIANVTGYLGVAWNQSEDQNFTAFGYPQAAPFDGNFLVTVNSEFGYETSSGNNDGGPNSIAMGNDMTGGSSGGPWIIGFGGGNWVNGHNDWKWNSLPQAMNSPYVDTRDCQVWSVAGRSDITC
jgi:V8-like Glu-specific endopeptidase